MIKTRKAMPEDEAWIKRSVVALGVESDGGAGFIGMQVGRGNCWGKLDRRDPHWRDGTRRLRRDGGYILCEGLHV
jgi:hypothetical protein